MARAGDDIELAGTVLQYVLPTAAGATAVGHRDFKGLLEFGESFALTEGATYGLKYAINERRPNGGNYSFPSAHTSVSFCGAEFLRKRYGWVWGVPAYAAASFVAYSRVESNNHWAWDVMGGAAVGIVSSYIFTRPYKGWNITPEAGPGFWGVVVSRRW